MNSNSLRPRARWRATGASCLVLSLFLFLLGGCGGASPAADEGAAQATPPAGPPPPAASGPTVASASPATVLVDGGTRITLRGTGFSGAMEASFGGVPGTGIAVLGPDALEVTAPAHAHGDVAVSVRNALGSDSLADAFAFVRFPPVLAGGDVQADAGAGTPASLRAPRICCAGSDVYVVWSEQRSGSSQDVFFQHSSDRGRTWLPTDVRLNTNTPGASASLAPRICLGDTHVYVCWMDNRNGHYEPYFNRSANGGATWMALDVRVSPASGSILGGEPSICCDGQNVAITWADDRNNAPFRGADVWANRSTDGGATWLGSDARVSSTAPGAAPAIVSRTQPACQGSTVCVAWIDWRNGHADVFCDRSTDAGATWQATDTQLDTAAASADPVLCASGSRVHVVWRDARQPGSYALFARSSANGGATFAPEVRVDHAPGGVVAGVPSAACAGADLYVTWGDPRNGTGADIWFNRSTDGGASFAASDTRLNNGVGTALVVSYDPVVCTNGSGMVHVAWPDRRNGAGFDVFASSSDDRGATWPIDGLRVDTDAPGASNAYEQDIACADALFFVAWQDDRRAPAPEAGFDIRVNGNGP